MKCSKLSTKSPLICLSFVLICAVPAFGMGDKPPETKAAAASVKVEQAVKVASGDTTATPSPSQPQATAPDNAVNLLSAGARLISINGGKLTAINPQLIGNAGASLIGNTGAALAGNSGGALAGNSGGALAGNSGGALAGNSGGALIGNTGAALIGNTGAALAGNSGGALAGNSGGALAGNSGGALIGNTAGGLSGGYGIASYDKQRQESWANPEGYADDQGRKYVVLQKTDPQGNKLDQFLVRTFDREGRMIAEARKTEDGKLLSENTWGYDSKGQAAVFEKKDGEGRTLEKSFAQEDGGSRTYRFRADGTESETEVRHANGAVDIEYKNEAGKVLQSTHISRDPDGQYTQIAAFAENGKFERIRNYVNGSRELYIKETDGSHETLKISEAGWQTRTLFDKDSNKVKEIKMNAQGAVRTEQSWTYNANSTVQVETKNGSGTRLETSTQQPDGVTETTKYRADGTALLTEKTSPAGATSTAYFDQAGTVEKEVFRTKNPRGAEERTVWPDGRQESVLQLSGGGKDIVIQEADGSKETTSIRNYGRPLTDFIEGEDASSRRRRYSTMETKRVYDSEGRLLSETEKRQGRMTYETVMSYDENGNLLKSVKKDGAGEIIEPAQPGENQPVTETAAPPADQPQNAEMDELLLSQALEVSPVSSPQESSSADLALQEKQLDDQMMQNDPALTEEPVPQSAVPAPMEPPAGIQETNPELQNDINQMIQEIQPVTPVSTAEEVRQSVTEDKIVQQTESAAQEQTDTDNSGII